MHILILLLAQPFFEPPAETVGDEPREMLVLDLNADTLPDIVTRNEDSNDLSILLARPDGTYAPADAYGVPVASDNVTAADLNADGFPDLLVDYPGNLLWYLNLGDATFSNPQSVRSAEHTLALAAADLDQDGREDVVLSGFQSDALFLHLAQPGGVLAPAVELGRFNGPGALLVRDFTGDGLADILVNAGDASITLLTNLGGAAFNQGAPVPAGDAAETPIATDLDLDGDLDVLFETTNDQVSILHNAGAGHFTSVQFVGPFPDVAGLASADLDADGYPDAGVFEDDESLLHVLLNDTTGKLAVAPGLLLEHVPRTLHLADLDTDADIDAIVTFVNRDVLQLLWNDGNAAFEPGPLLHTAEGPDVVAPADLDLDADVDIAVAGADQNIVLIHENDGAGAFSSPLHAIGPDPKAVAVADLNADGLDDVAAAHAFSIPGNVTVLLSTGASLVKALETFAGAGPVDVVAADLDGDADTDLAFACYGTDDAVVLLNHGDATFAEPLHFPITGDPETLAAGDLDADADLDLVVATDDPDQLLVLLNRGDATFDPPLATPLPATPQDIALAHVNDDAFLDLLVARHTQHLDVYYASADATLALANTIDLGLNPPANVVAADADHDGLIDLAIGAFDGARILYGTGDADFEPGPEFAGGASAVALVDLDAKHDLDLLTQPFSSGLIRVHASTGRRTYELAQEFSAGSSLDDAALGEIGAEPGIDLAAAASSPPAVWVSRGIPAACPADFNADGDLNVLDFVAFQLAWQAQDPSADCDADTEFTVLDFVCFQALFQKGCP